MNTLKNQRGLAAVEFAIVLPVMLFLMLATAEFGRIFYHYNTLTKAVQTGARYASRPLLGTNKLTNMNTDFVQNIQNFVVYGKENVDGTDTPVLDGLTASSANVVVSSSAADKTITIEATYNYSFVVLSDFSLLGYSLPTLTLRASVVTDTSLG